MREYLPSRHTEREYICNISEELKFHREDDGVGRVQESYSGRQLKIEKHFLDDYMILRVLVWRLHRSMTEGCSVDWHLPNSAMSECEFGEVLLPSWKEECIYIWIIFLEEEKMTSFTSVNFLPPESRAWGGFECHHGVPGCRREDQGQWDRARSTASERVCFCNAYCHTKGGPPLCWGGLSAIRSTGSPDVSYEGTIMFEGQDPRGAGLAFSACYISCPEVWLEFMSHLPCQITSGYIWETLAGVWGQEVLCDFSWRCLFTPARGPK